MLPPTRLISNFWRTALSLENEFENAADRVQKLSEKPENDILLELYALYKQATEGDVTSDKPSRLKFRERAKHDAWEERAGMEREEAMQNYIDLVDDLVERDQS